MDWLLFTTNQIDYIYAWNTITWAISQSIYVYNQIVIEFIQTSINFETNWFFYKYVI